MRNKWLVAVVSASLLVAFLPPSVADDDDKIPKLLIGKWKLISCEERDGKISQSDIDSAKIYLDIDNDTITFYERNRKKKTLKYRLATNTVPFGLQLIDADNKINYAIFEIKKGTLTICSSNKYRPNSPEGQPDGFTVTSAKNSKLGGLSLEVYTLEK